MTEGLRRPDNPVEFRQGLITGNLSRIRSVPKTDLHNHCLLGIPLERLRRVTGRTIPPFRHLGNGIRDINDWIKREYSPVFQIPEMFPLLVRESFRQAETDGIALLEMSMDTGFGALYGIPPEEVISTLQEAHREIAPQIRFRPSLGFSRSVSPDRLWREAEPYLASGWFYSVDLYDDEKAAPVERFRELFAHAKRAGLQCRAHAGEFGSAEEVREAVDTLQLDAVQHGIAVASSPEVMKWLAGNDVPLHICPASNISLNRTESYATHPVRILYDHGVRITLNTDDVTLFDQGVSEQFLHLFQANRFSVDELEEIRLNGFRE